MAITGISITETEEYISESDEKSSEKEGATIFILGALDVNLRAQLADGAMSMVQGQGGGMEMKMNKGTRNLEATRFGLKDWRNFKDKDNKDIKFELVDFSLGGKAYKVVSDDCLAALPAMVLNELGEKILQESSMTEELSKKLEALS